MSKHSGTTRKVHGRVKWFDPDKGYGFVVANDGGPDILLHVNTLRNFGQSSVEDGTSIEVNVVDTNRGQQVLEVIAIDPPDEGSEPDTWELENLDPALIRSLPFEPACLKWMDWGKGYGFATTFDHKPDVFVLAELLRSENQLGAQEGEAIAVRVYHGEQGRMAVEVTSWDNARKQQTD